MRIALSQLPTQGWPVGDTIEQEHVTDIGP